jgi:serine protease inhibitor
MSHFVALPSEKNQALQPIQFSPTTINQRVIRARNGFIGTTSFKTANVMSGTNQKTVFKVQADKVTRPCRFLSIFVANADASHVRQRAVYREISVIEQRE